MIVGTSYPKPALILICGYARAGKDTLADGLTAGALGPTSKVALADPLKETADNAIKEIIGSGVKFPGFRNEAFKVTNRALLVELGKTCRAIHQDCFIEMALEKASALIAQGITAIITDVRYSNELQRCHDLAQLKNLPLYTMLIETSGIGPANDEERTNQALLLIRSETSNIGWSDHTRWQINEALAIYRHGRELARSIHI